MPYIPHSDQSLGHKASNNRFNLNSFHDKDSKTAYTLNHSNLHQVNVVFLHYVYFKTKGHTKLIYFNDVEK